MSGLSLSGTVELGAATLTYDVAVAPGEHLTVIGPNGAGKSTFLRTLAGLLRLTSGQLLEDGCALDDPATGAFVPPHDRDIVLQPQTGALFPHLDVLDNVAFPLRSRLGRSRSREHAAAVLDRLDCTTLASRHPDDLSGGEAARISLARSLAAEPRVLLLDEPASALDVMARAALRHQITEVAGTVITVTHDPIEARLLGDRLVVVEGGRTSQTGGPNEIAAAPSSGWVADFLDVNIVSGSATGTTVATERTTITIAEDVTGPVHVTFPANAVTLHADRPHGSARNVWEVTVEALVADDGRVQVHFSGPIDARAVVTPTSATQLGLAPGQACWASVKATELQVLPA